MSRTGCRICRTIRLVVLSVMLGAASGFSVLALGGTRELSMAATFGGAIVPLLWHARRSRRGRSGPS
ncbi:MAG: hypothetical protein QNJ91_00130 [Gammaproteobacteria bacterium]|nr:hypothetical protein [Gammaproteobacteria bacterium]